jgi:transposase/predicted DNA-binding protein YlxM (UPF0122 family)
MVPPLHVDIQTAFLHLSEPSLSLADIGERFGISKQAVQKRLKKAIPFLVSYGVVQETQLERSLKAQLATAKAEIARLLELVNNLQRLLVLAAVTKAMHEFFAARIHKFWPNFKVTRLFAPEKKQIIDLWLKFKRLGGSMREFCQRLGRSEDTLRKWLTAYEEHGLSGLYDKTSRPHHFAHALPLWIKEQLFILFMRHPRWTPNQYEKWLRYNPGFGVKVSIHTIAKLKDEHERAKLAEDERLKKLWIFPNGTHVWTVDFTCIEKADGYKLQLLTVSDHNSRFLFETALFLETSTDQVISHLEGLFIKYGKPAMIKADNGQEFRLACREDLLSFGVYLLNSPNYYAPFNGAHERIHRTLKEYIEKFAYHHNLTRLNNDIQQFRDDYNFNIPLETLGLRTPGEVYYTGEEYDDVLGRKVITPYVKDDQIRMKFINRNGQSARVAIDLSTGEQENQKPIQ